MSEDKIFEQDPTDLETIDDGIYIYTDKDDGSMIGKSYKNGKLDGTCFYEYNTGELWIEENYKDGVIHGTTTYYNKDGSVKGRQVWENGVLQPREIENMQAELSKADMRKIDEAKVKMFKYFLSRL